MIKKLILFFLVAIFLCLSGCATMQTHETQDMLNSRMNEMTYEEALQRFGVPSQCAEAGATKVCTWIYGEGGSVTYTPPAPMHTNNPYALDFSSLTPTTSVTVPIQRPTARLTFTNDVLTYWQLTGNWK